jgi:hypothetical protein
MLDNIRDAIKQLDALSEDSDAVREAWELLRPHTLKLVKSSFDTLGSELLMFGRRWIHEDEVVRIMTTQKLMGEPVGVKVQFLEAYEDVTMRVRSVVIYRNKNELFSKEDRVGVGHELVVRL